MLVKVYGASVRGLSAIPVTIEVNASRGIKFFLVGLPDNAVKESHERIVAAVENSGYRFPSKQFLLAVAGCLANPFFPLETVCGQYGSCGYS